MSSVNKNKWMYEIHDWYQKTQSHHKPYLFGLKGINLSVLPDVFSPKYFIDSYWFAEQVTKLVGTDSLLEIGTGTGIIATMATLHGAQVVSTDINPQAVKNAKQNFKKYDLDIPVYKGNIYQPLPQKSKFDYIFWSHPFHMSNKKKEKCFSEPGLIIDIKG